MDEQQVYPEKVQHNYAVVQRHPGGDHSNELLEKGIVTITCTMIDVLGIELIGIRQFKLVTTLDTWLNKAAYL